MKLKTGLLCTFFSHIEYEDVATKYKRPTAPRRSAFLALTVVGTQSRPDTRCFKKYLIARI